VRFLGYVPWAAGTTIGERLLACRRDRGLCQNMMGRRLGIDPGTLSPWERNLRVPGGRYAWLVEAFLERLARQRSILTDIAGQPSTP
jgi:transcriptional regulator with XRE-family HTH domain